MRPQIKKTNEFDEAEVLAGLNPGSLGDVNWADELLKKLTSRRAWRDWIQAGGKQLEDLLYNSSNSTIENCFCNVDMNAQHIYGQKP